MRKTDLGNSFQRLLHAFFVDYRGFRGEKDKDGRIVWKGTPYQTIEDFRKAVDNYIQQGGSIIQNSIKDGNKKV